MKETGIILGQEYKWIVNGQIAIVIGYDETRAFPFDIFVCNCLERLTSYRCASRMELSTFPGSKKYPVFIDESN